MYAYKLKRQLNDQQDKSQFYSIKTSDPVVILPEKKFTHCKGAVYNPTMTYHRSTQSLGKTMSNVGLSAIHNKLNSQENYPLAYKVKYDENSLPVSGDYIDDPRKTVKLLQSTPSSKLTIPGRAADFKSEVQWRLLLRNDNY